MNKTITPNNNNSDLDLSVGLSACRSYNQGQVLEAVEEALEPLGGLKSFLNKNDRVLLKPNLLTNATPESAVTTHPEFIKAVATKVWEAGASQICLGDSPARGSLERVAKECDLLRLQEEAGISLLPFKTARKVSSPTGYLFPLAEEAFGFDFVINLGKLKTHALTGLTGTVKNCYGFMVGMNKVQYHARFPLVHDFARMLLELYLTVQPDLSLIDGVVAMEGPGPRSGRPKPLGVIAASTNAIAVDAVCAKITGFSSKEMTTWRAAAERKIAGSQWEKLKIHGPLEELITTSFDKGASVGGWSFLWRILPARMRNLQEHFRLWPVINERCITCRLCFEHCPAEVLKLETANNNQKVVIDYSGCLRCYCCQEICPEGAIELKRKKPE